MSKINLCEFYRDQRAFFLKSAFNLNYTRAQRDSFLQNEVGNLFCTQARLADARLAVQQGWLFLQSVISQGFGFRMESVFIIESVQGKYRVIFFC